MSNQSDLRAFGKCGRDLGVPTNRSPPRLIYKSRGTEAPPTLLSAAEHKRLSHPVQRLVARFQTSFQLPRFDCFQDFAEPRSGLHSHRDQIISSNQWRRNDWLVSELLPLLEQEIVVLHHS